MVPAAVGVVAIPVITQGSQRWGRGMAGDPLDLPGVTLVVIAAASLLLRRRRPIITLAVVTASVMTYLSLGYPYGPVLVTFVLAVYSVARHRPFRPAALATGIAILVLLSHVYLRDGAEPSLAGVPVAVAWAVVPFAIGFAIRQRGHATARDREAQLQRRVDAERLRLSRDVHDVVGHGLAAINLQASVALRSADRDDPRARERTRDALAAIESASAASLDELRSVLAGLPGEAAPHQPAPGLSGLPALVERMSAPGSPVTLRIEGATAPLTGAPDLAAYRVAQEALTNAVRHGTGGPITVVITHAPDAVTLAVENLAPSDPPRGASPGMGLPGMRDRLAAVGGSLTTSDGGGRFRLRAHIPREESR